MAKFPLFSDKEDFTGWYNKVLSVLATPKCSTLYDHETNDVVPEDKADPAISNLLYSNLVLIISGEAQILCSQNPPSGEGVLYLKALKDTYKQTFLDMMSLQKATELARPMRKST